MKKFYLLLILLFFTMQQLTAQTLETFEAVTTGQANFTSNGKLFNLTNTYVGFTTVEFANLGYNGSNRFIQVADGAGTQSLGQTGYITAATGSFKLTNMWIYLTGNSAQAPNATFDGAAGSVTLTGKLGGVPQFTIVKNTAGTSIGFSLPANGFIPVNFATDGASNYSNINIDQLEIQLSSNYDYFAIDNFTWVNGVNLPTVSTVAATNVKAVSATIGGNVTADGGDVSVQRGIVWATTPNPTILSNKFQIGTGTGIFSGTVPGLTPGSVIYYRAYATNSAGTSYGTELTLTTNAALSTSSATKTDVSCNGGANGTATVVATGGGGSYTYSWAPSGGTGATASGLAAGTYTVTIGDSELTTITRTLTVAQPAVISPVPTHVNVSCNGANNGSAKVTPTGGTGGYTYLWSNGATTSTISSLSSGVYSVDITDANSCVVTQSFTITQPAPLVASQGTINNVSCNGGTNGSATVNVTGGASGYTYSWSPSGGTAATASGLTSGTYTVTVTDANACQTTQAFTITQPAPFNVTTSQVNLVCNGASTGSATVNVTGGAGSFTYSWSPSGGTAATASGLTAGNYTVTITDANTCQTTRNFTLTQPSAIVATPSAVTNVNCYGEATGSATVSATGGTGAYTYSWAPSGGTAATASGLTSGTYTVTVTDANACQATQSFTITQPAAILSASTASTGVSCFGGSNGTASVNVTGGTPGYTYLWAPLGGTTSSISGKPAGNYTCTITDSKGCTLIKNITISTPAAFSATTTKTDVSCNGGTNGTATVTPSGATAPYTYSWSPTGGNGASASGLAAGTYTIIVQDANTCSYTVNVTIAQPSSLAVVPSQTNVLCNGGATGSASVFASGGTPGYTYLWAPSGGTAATATGLAAGSYTCKVTDTNGCMFTQGFIITEPAILAASTSKIDATCSTGGQAAVNPSGGTLPYTYLWSPNGETTAIVTGLVAGNYSASITDANGCTINKNFTINTTNTLVAVKSQVNVFCNGSSTGSATVVPSGAPGPFTYVWSPIGGNADTASNLSAGIYNVTVTSANGCSTVVPFTITEPTPLAISPSQTNLSCNSGSNGSATVNVTGGTGVYTYSWAPSGGTAATASGLTAGTYTVTITDTNLCQATQSFTLTEPTALAASTNITNVSCNGGSNGAATINVTGGTGAYTYTWSPTGGSAATASGLTAGTYTIVATDANNCSVTENITITEPTALAATLTQTNVTCTGGNDGEATVAVTGGTGAYTYIWSPAGGTAATATGLTAGNYIVNITDANGCSILQAVSILTSPDVTAPVPDVTNLPDITNYCSIVSTDILIPTATDVCAGIVNATTTDPLNYTAEGTYVITWSYDDGNGNISSQNQTLHVLASPLDLVTFSDASFTYDGTVHALQVANLPAGASVAYSITPAASTQNGATNAGIYTVTAVVSPAVTAPNCSSITLTAQLTINKAVQQITFGAIPAKILGAINNFNLDAVSNSGLAIRYSFTYTSALPPASVSASGLVNLLRSGDLLIVAHQDGDANYLPAPDVSQILVIKNNDVSVTEIKIGTKSYPNPAKELKYVMQCGETNVNIVITNLTSATITPSANFTITPPKPGIYTQNVGVTSQDGSTTTNYTLTVEKPFGFFDIVKEKFNNVLLVNNNPQTNGGYEFIAYQWFKNGQLVGTGQYYSAGDDLANSLDTSADFSVKLTTKDGKVLTTCSTKISLQKPVAAKLYPNPIQIGKVITVEADFPLEELENMQISLYSVSGQLVKTLKSSSAKTEIQLPDAESNMYIVVLETANIKKTLKVIVNK